MASGMLPFGPVVVRAAAITSGDDRKPDQTRNWWSPLFGFSSEPDYIDKKIEPDPVRAPKKRFVPGTFTEEKAKQLRRMTNDATSSHDSMYHSAIASRLASDFSDRRTAP